MGRDVRLKTALRSKFLAAVQGSETPRRSCECVPLAAGFKFWNNSIHQDTSLKKKLLVLFTAGAFLVSFGGFDHEGDPPSPRLLPKTGAFRAKRPSQHFKNITVLKGIPVDEFMGTMGLFSAALSFCCKDCHTGAGTSNPQVGRRSAAEGHRAPHGPDGGQHQSGEFQRTPGGDVLDLPSRQPQPGHHASHRYHLRRRGFHAHRRFAGGESGHTPARLPPIRFSTNISRLWAAPTRSPRSPALPPRETAICSARSRRMRRRSPPKRPNLLATVVHQREGDVARTYDGREAWVMLPLTVVGQYPLNGSALDGAKTGRAAGVSRRAQAVLHQLARHLSPRSSTESRSTWCRAACPADLLATFYFDKQTGLLTRMVRYAASSMGRVPTQIDYSDYRHGERRHDAVSNGPTAGSAGRSSMS